MSPQQFITRLAITTLFAVLLVLGLNFQAQIALAKSLSWTTIGIFVVFSILVYFMGSYSAKQKNKNTFTSVILMVMMFKMLICILLIAIYVKTYEPTDNFFFIPFFSIYILYTIFEVQFMTRLGKHG